MMYATRRILNSQKQYDIIATRLKKKIREKKLKKEKTAIDGSLLIYSSAYFHVVDWLVQDPTKGSYVVAGYTAGCTNRTKTKASE